MLLTNLIKKNINTSINLSSPAKRVITPEIEALVRFEDDLLNQVELELRTIQKKLSRQNRERWSVIAAKGDYEEVVALSAYLAARRISNNSQQAMEILKLEKLDKTEVFVDENKILLLLQKQPLTVQNIADTFDISLEEAHNVVRRLFVDGLIDKLDSSFWQKIFPFLVSRQRRASEFIDSATHFVVTLKGHFRLNPVIMIDK